MAAATDPRSRSGSEAAARMAVLASSVHVEELRFNSAWATDALDLTGNAFARRSSEIRATTGSTAAAGTR